MDEAATVRARLVRARGARRRLRWQPASVIQTMARARARNLPPGAFAPVMATGIVSQGVAGLGARGPADALLAVAVVSYAGLLAGLVWRVVRYPRELAVCSETCVGRLRYLGVILYDPDKVGEAAAVTDEKDLYRAQLDCFLDPDDPAVARAAADSGIPDDWIEAARRSPVHALISRYRVALPLHPEYRTMPMVWYVPPLSPVVDALTATGHDGEDPVNLFGAIDSLRIPLGYLAGLFTAGDPEPVEAALCRLAAMRSHMRRINLGEERDPAIAAAVGMDQDGIDAMYRLLALAKYEERYVIPTTYTAGSGGGTPTDSCSLDGDGLPGMMPYDLPGIDTFHTPPAPEPAGAGSGLAGRVNLLNWNGRGRPAGLFPRRDEETR